MGKILSFFCCLALVILLSFQLLNWMITGELQTSPIKGSSRMLIWDDEPVRIVFTVVGYIGVVLLGLWGLFDALRNDDAPAQAPEPSDHSD